MTYVATVRDQLIDVVTARCHAGEDPATILAGAAQALGAAVVILAPDGMTADEVARLLADNMTAGEEHGWERVGDEAVAGAKAVMA